MARVLPPMRFRFAEADREQYGDQWWTFDETQLHGLRSRELVAMDTELRAELGLNILTALESFLAGETAGALAVMWMALRLAGEPVRLAEFDPLPMLAAREVVVPQADRKAADADPPASTSSDSPAKTPEE